MHAPGCACTGGRECEGKRKAGALRLAFTCGSLALARASCWAAFGAAVTGRPGSLRSPLLRTGPTAPCHRPARRPPQVASATNDVAGDGTTTATVLTRAILVEGCKSVAAGMNPMDLRRGINLAVRGSADGCFSRAPCLLRAGVAAAGGLRKTGQRAARTCAAASTWRWVHRWTAWRASSRLSRALRSPSTAAPTPGSFLPNPPTAPGGPRGGRAQGAGQDDLHHRGDCAGGRWACCGRCGCLAAAAAAAAAVAGAAMLLSQLGRRGWAWQERRRCLPGRGALAAASCRSRLPRPPARPPTRHLRRPPAAPRSAPSPPTVSARSAS